MPRTLSGVIQDLIAQGTQRTVHLLTFQVGIATYRFAEDAVRHLGFDYQPYLLLESGARYSERLRGEPVTVKLQNITLETAELLKEEGSAIQGVEATLERLYLAARETVVIFRGRISEVEINERDATITIASELDPTATQIPKRKYSALCVWDFKDANCGYVDGVDPNDPGTGQPFVICPKDFASCQARSREERFPGFLTVTRELTESVEGQTPDANDDRALSAVLGDYP